MIKVSFLLMYVAIFALVLLLSTIAVRNQESGKPGW